MLSYNDYERTVFGYLKNYTKFRTRLKNMQLEIADKQAEIDTFGGAKAAAYGLSAGGSWSELNETERNASKLLELQTELSDMETDRRRLETLLQCLDNALESLDGISEQVIRLKLIERRQWKDVIAILETETDIHYCERNFQKILSKAVKEITGIIFGGKAEQMKLNFMFLERRNTNGKIQS